MQQAWQSKLPHDNNEPKGAASSSELADTIRPMPSDEESHTGRAGSGDFLALHDAHGSAEPMMTGSSDAYNHNHFHGGRSGPPAGGTATAAAAAAGRDDDAPTPLEIPPTPTTSTRQALAVPRVMRRILTVLFLHVFAIMMMVPVITELALQRVFAGDEGTTAVFLTGENLRCHVRVAALSCMWLLQW